MEEKGKKMTVRDLLREKGITSEEAEKLGLTSLIEECEERERIIGENSETTRMNLNKVFDSLGTLGKNLTEIVEATENIMTVALKNLPDSKFQHE